MMTEHPTRFELDRMSALELPEEERATMELHLSGCERCRIYLDELEEERQLMLEQMPPDQFYAKLMEQSESSGAAAGTARGV